MSTLSTIFRWHLRTIGCGHGHGVIGLFFRFGVLFYGDCSLIFFIFSFLRVIPKEFWLFGVFWLFLQESKFNRLRDLLVPSNLVNSRFDVLCIVETKSCGCLSNVHDFEKMVEIKALPLLVWSHSTRLLAEINSIATFLTIMSVLQQKIFMKIRYWFGKLKNKSIPLLP